MRRALPTAAAPDHLGLAYGAWAPLGEDGKVPEGQRAEWLSALETIPPSTDYLQYFERWRRSFTAGGDRTFELRLTSRLLVGSGNSSATDVGITLHHTWGVPLVPGSTLKGLTAHYVDAIYGPTDWRRPVWEQEGDERIRADYQGVTRDGRWVQRGPGVVYRSLFGAPDALEDEEMRKRGFNAGAVAGFVTFHDALVVPPLVTDNPPQALDVLTVHQKAYYDSQGKSWPKDYDGPNPVPFLSVRRGVRFLFALSGPAEWTELAERLLCDALEKWGVGGKTSAGYGRFVPCDRAEESSPATTAARDNTLPKPGTRVEVTLLEARTKKGGWRAQHEASGLTGHIQNSSDVPSTLRPGARITLIVTSVSAKELAFRYAPDAAKQRTSE